MAQSSDEEPAGIVPVSTGEQIAAVETLAREIWTEHYTPIIGRAQVDYMLAKFQSKGAIAEQIREGYAYFLIEKRKDRIGYLSIQPRGDELFLSKIYVKSSERGKGHGKTAVRFAEGFARERKLMRITLTVNRNNSRSIGAYEKLGFEKIAALVQDIGGGFVMDDYRMGKNLERESMKTVKIMPCLDMKEGRVVKGVHFVEIKDAGDPVENAALYQQEGADELAMLDIAATLENRKTRLEWVKKVSAVISIPLTVGGGISTLDDIDLLLTAGAAKVSMNSAAVQRPALIEEAAGKYGSERITVAVDGCRNPTMPSGFELVVAGGTKPVGKDAVAWAKQCEALGAGVILPTSMDGDGTQAGYDLEFTKAISDAVGVPVVASGGAGKLSDFYDAAAKAGASVLLAASVFHYRLLSIRQVKEYLKERGIAVVL